ncbi:synaptonemal complex protein 2-like [Eleginops maclovinus]|uniref:synaptonemal complex protein 2-like n=1 Tax=Eleginops maclovinus TaxID=56733 RepID=UPI003080EE77
MFHVKMEDCLKRADSSSLVSLLQGDLSSYSLTSLSQLVTTDLCVSGISRVSVVMKSLEVLSENTNDLQKLLSLGLAAKVERWFEAVHGLLTSDPPSCPPPLLSVTEQFYDFFQLIGPALPVSQLSVFLHQLAGFSVETGIIFRLRLEAIRTLNSIVESLSREPRRRLQNLNHTQMLSQLAAAVLTVGDYELQASLSEALCRLTPMKERRPRANQWFPIRDISSAFCDMRDRDFEVDCRRFLNFVNSNHGDQRRVYTFPCLRAFLDSNELFPPKDEKLDEFWIDFNVGSECVSFFIDEPQGFLWGSLHLQQEDVDFYSLQECSWPETVLSVWLKFPIMHRDSRGQVVQLSFNSEHLRNLQQAAGLVLPKMKRSSDDTVLVSPPADKHNGRPHSDKPMSKSQPNVFHRPSPSSGEESPVPKKVKSSPGGTVQVSPPADQHNKRSYSRKKPMSKSQLKVLPLSSPSSGEDSPVRRKGLVLTAGGYPLDQTEGLLAQDGREEPELDAEESGGEGPDCLQTESSLEGAGLPLDGAGPVMEAEPGSHLPSDITAAFNTFKTQLDQRFTSRWRSVETEVLRSFTRCQQQVSSLLTAVHQHRLVLRHRFESSVTDQLKRLHEESNHLTSINTQTLNVFQTEMQQLGSFCEEHLHRQDLTERKNTELPEEKTQSD